MSSFGQRLLLVEGLLCLVETRLKALERLRHSHKVGIRSAGIENGRASHRDKEAAGKVPKLE